MRPLAFMASLPLLLPMSPSAVATEGDPAEICDRLAADPFAGFGPKSWDKPFQDIDGASAVPACEEALRLHPGEPRYRLQMAIAYLAAQDQDRAKPLLRQLVEEGNAPAMVLLANFSGDRQSLELISKAASLNNPAALILLAFAQLTGDGVKQNVLEGIRLLSHAADLGNTEAMVVLAGIYLEGRFGVPPDAAEGRRLILDAAARGDPSAKEVIEQVERAEAAASARMAPPTPTKPPAP